MFINLNSPAILSGTLKSYNDGNEIQELPLEILVQIFDNLGSLELQSTEEVSKYWKQVTLITVTHKKEFLALKNFVQKLITHLSETAFKASQQMLCQFRDKNLKITNLGQFHQLINTSQTQLALLLKEIPHQRLVDSEQAFRNPILPDILKDVFALTRLYQKIDLAKSEKKSVQKTILVSEIMTECQRHLWKNLEIEVALDFQNYNFIANLIFKQTVDLKFLLNFLSKIETGNFKDKLLNSLVESCINKRDFDKNLLIFKEINNHSKASDLFITYLKAYLHPKVQNVLEIFSLIQERHLTEEIYILFLQNCLKDNDFQSFLEITKKRFKHFQEQDVLTEGVLSLAKLEEDIDYQKLNHTMIRHLIDTGRTGQALELIHHLPFKFRESTFLTVIEALASLGKFREALELTPFTAKKLDAYSSIAFFLLLDGKSEELQKIFKIIPEKSDRNQLIYDLSLKCLNYNDADTAYEAAQYIEIKSIRNQAYSNIIKYLININDFARALIIAGQISDRATYKHVINKMKNKGYLVDSL